MSAARTFAVTTFPPEAAESVETPGKWMAICRVEGSRVTGRGGGQSEAAAAKKALNRCIHLLENERKAGTR